MTAWLLRSENSGDAEWDKQDRNRWKVAFAWRAQTGHGALLIFPPHLCFVLFELVGLFVAREVGNQLQQGCVCAT